MRPMRSVLDQGDGAIVLRTLELLRCGFSLVLRWVTFSSFSSFSAIKPPLDLLWISKARESDPSQDKTEPASEQFECSEHDGTVALV